ncbi:CFI-box-CTERM domain-containing protein [Pseudobacteriovorax antillogorgiicola]|uniref:Uncharacterized protein n=1 Tax=Pseudobacteriovorax antillogorgiicola TaxID=1513793 RepID=A0A1Y6BXI7_9BACT|nr:CFI-box-CTERM domain-containing protein [Pseudobacteriovorax antillogorgiicola]TCS50317.1 hypothetical protein EDD56_113135 [Pseudobacteriovorax antillogorgiicola]SMF34150.1 hypothetical protein SAMN06296036_110134 [Pseudobacteriovorax antillogorgiicola]
MHSTAFKLLIVSALLLSGNAWADIDFNEDITIARLPRNDSSYIELTVSINDIPDADFGGSPTNDGIVNLMVQRLDVCIEQNTGETDSEQLCDNMITYSGKGSLDPTDISKLSTTYFMTFIDSAFEIVDNEDDTSDITFGLKIQIDESDLAEGETRSFSLSTQFELDYQDITDKLDVTTSQSTPVNQSPASLTSRSTNRGVLMFWTGSDSVTFQDGTTGRPSGVRGILVPVTDGDQELNIATTYRAVAGSDPVTYSEVDLDGCILSVSLATDNTQTDSCTFSCSELGYINDDRITSEVFPTVKVKSTVSGEALSFSGSDLVDPEATNQAYAMIAQYLPDGLLQQSSDGQPFEASCVIAYPTLSFTYAQLSGAGDPKQQNPTCFIATAAYGHPMHQNLNDLRWFRDNILESIAIGRTLVSLYYEYSPALASRIAINDDYKTFTRAALWAPVKYISALRQSPGATLMATLSLMIAPFALGAFRRRAKQA